MRRLTSREQIIFIVTMVLAIGYLGMYWVYRPIQEKIDEVDQQIVFLEKKMVKELRSVREIEEQYQKYSSFLNLFVQEGEEAEVMSSMISEIEKAAQNLNLKISNLKPERVRNEDLYNRFTVSVVLDSNLSSVMQFIYLLQDDPYFYDIEDIRFERSNRRNDTAMKTRIGLGKIFFTAIPEES